MSAVNKIFNETPINLLNSNSNQNQMKSLSASNTFTNSVQQHLFFQNHYTKNPNSLTLPILKTPSIKTMSEFSKIIGADPNMFKKNSKNQQQIREYNDYHHFESHLVPGSKPQNPDSLSVRSVITNCPAVIGINAENEYRDDKCTIILAVISYILVILFFPISLLLTFRVVQEYERAVIFCLGRLKKNSRGPGIIFVLPCIESAKKVDMRTVSFDVAPQEVLTKDSVTVSVDAVVYYR